MDKKKIYVVNKGSHDYSMAQEFGELVFMSEGNMPSRFAASKMYRAFKSYIDNSNPLDYILLTSMTIMCSIACAMFAQKHNRLNLLLYKPDSQNAGGYVERIVVF